jgi:hypothetical protein
LEDIPDEDEGHDEATRTVKMSRLGTQRSNASQSFSGQRTATRHSSETPSLVQDKGASPTPSTESSVGYSAYQAAGTLIKHRSSIFSPSGLDGLRSDWSHLPLDLQFYLAYFYENLTHLHYSLKIDSGDFLRTRFLDAALRNDALLYAVVGFSAFQLTLKNPAGKIQDFLQYYNKAVSLLLNSLKKGERHNNSTILAILQLATIEVRFGFFDRLPITDKSRNSLVTGSICLAIKKQHMRY